VVIFLKIFPEFFSGIWGPYLMKGIKGGKTRHFVSIWRTDTGEGGGSIPLYGKRGGHNTPT